MKKLFVFLLAAAMVLGTLAGCGTAETTESAAANETVSAEQAESTSDQDAVESDAPPASDTVSSDVTEMEDAEGAEDPDEPEDFTASNANHDYAPFRAMLRTLTTELPITEDPVTLTYFLGFETNTLNYIPTGDLMDHQIWAWLRDNTGVNIELQVVDKTSESEKFNLMIASGEYADMFSSAGYTAGVEAAYDEDIVIDLGSYLEENMPNYWRIIHSDQNLLEDVMDGRRFLCVYAVSDQCANPSGEGTFIRMDWLEDLGLDVPRTYDELTSVLEAFKTEKGALEPMSMFNTVSMNNGLLMGGYGSIAELSTNGMGTNIRSGFYQVDGEVIYGATADGTRKYLSWLHDLNERGLISFENMQARETNPFSDMNAGEAARGETGYIFSNQPFGGNYSTMAADQYGDTECNWWPVQDVAEHAGDHIPFYEETRLSGMNLVISSQCENVETALQFLDYGYSYEGSVLYNFGFQKGSGQGSYETWDYDENGEPKFDGAVMNSIASTNIASSVVATKDLMGVVFDTRLSFEFGERELSCFDAWSTNKGTECNLGTDTALTSDENVEASSLYSDILTYVATSVLQFINGDLDINDDTVWLNYVSTVESMNLSDLTSIVQTAYDRAHS